MNPNKTFHQRASQIMPQFIHIEANTALLQDSSDSSSTTSHVTDNSDDFSGSKLGYPFTLDYLADDENTPINPKPDIDTPYYKNADLVLAINNLHKSMREYDKSQRDVSSIKRVLEKFLVNTNIKDIKDDPNILNEYSREPLALNSNQNSLLRSIFGENKIFSSRYLLGRLLDKNSNKVYENEVSGIMLQLLRIYFNNWYIKPEDTQKNRKKPDYVVNGRFRGEHYPKIFVEVKKHKGDHFNKILIQTHKSSVNVLGNKNELALEDNTFLGSNLYIIAIRGTKIAFLEKIHGIDEYSTYKLPHRDSIIPLSQSSTGGLTESEELKLLQEQIKSSAIKDESHRFKYKSNIANNTDVIKNSQYYVIDLINHYELVHKVFCYINSNQARGFSPK